MSYAGFLETIRREARFYEELGRSGAIEPRWEAENLLVDIRWNLLSSPAREWLSGQELDAARDAIDLWLRAQVIAQGPKVFRPTLETCLAMEQIAIHIPLADYAQPYPVMIVECPED